MRKTHINEIDRVLPGEFVEISNDQIHFKKYWEPQYERTYTGTLTNAYEDVQNALQEAVSISTRADVPVGILLSGGIDSSAVASLAQKAGSEVHAITAGYQGAPNGDERSVARDFAEKLKLHWYDVELNFNDFESYFDEYIFLLGEPVADPASIPQWGIFKKARELGIKVLLSGIGGDELFFGYPIWNRAGRILDLRRRLQIDEPRALKQNIRLGLHFLHEPILLARALLQKDKTGMLWHADFLRRHNFLEQVKWPDCKSTTVKDSTEEYWNPNLNGYDQIARILFSTWLPGNCLFLGDSLGMGNSVEVRCPLLDFKLVDLVNSLPVEWRFSTSETKPLLKKVLHSVVPDNILYGPKQGFTPPHHLIMALAQKYSSSPLSFPQPCFEGAVINRVLASQVGAWSESYGRKSIA